MRTDQLEERYGLPPARHPRALGGQVGIIGRRVVVGRYDTEHDLMLWDRDLIAASDVIVGEGGRLFVRVVDERQWWTWLLDQSEERTPACPRATAWPAYLVFLE